MNASVDKAQFAWQPLTVRGVAAFARASLGRLLLVQFIVALLAAGTVVWFLHKAWFPTIGEAIRQLPPQGEIRSGRLDWQGPTPVAPGRGAVPGARRRFGPHRRGALAGARAGGVWPGGFQGLFSARLRARRVSARLGGGVQPDRARAVVGRLGAGDSGHGGGVGGGGADAELGVFGDGVLSAGVAGRVLRESGLEPGRELAPGGRGADAGGAA